MNPILEKELRGVLRERRGWLAPVIYAAVLAAAVYLLFPSAPHGVPSALGRAIASEVAALQLIAILVLGPLAGAAAIAGERERGTWARLLASPVPRLQIAIGKLLAALLYVLLNLCASLPVAAVSLLYGGTDLRTLGGLYLSHVVLASVLVSIGLAVSTAFSRTWAATLSALAITLGAGMLTFALWMSVRGSCGWSSELSLVELPLLLNPAYSLVLFMEGDRLTDGLLRWWMHYVCLGAVGTGAFAFASQRLARMRD